MEDSNIINTSGVSALDETAPPPKPSEAGDGPSQPDTSQTLFPESPVYEPEEDMVDSEQVDENVVSSTDDKAAEQEAKEATPAQMKRKLSDQPQDSSAKIQKLELPTDEFAVSTQNLDEEVSDITSGTKRKLEDPLPSTSRVRTPVRASPRKITKRSNSVEVSTPKTPKTPRTRPASADISKTRKTPLKIQLEKLKETILEEPKVHTPRPSVEFVKEIPPLSKAVEVIAEESNSELNDSQNFHLELSPTPDESTDEKPKAIYSSDPVVAKDRQEIVEPGHINETRSEGYAYSDHSLSQSLPKDFNKGKTTDQESTDSVCSIIESPDNIPSAASKIISKLSNGNSSTPTEIIAANKRMSTEDSDGTPDMIKLNGNKAKRLKNESFRASNTTTPSTISPLQNGHSLPMNTPQIPVFDIHVSHNEDCEFLSLYVVRTDNDLGMDMCREYQRISKRFTIDPYMADVSTSNSPSSVTSGGMINLPNRTSFASTVSSTSTTSSNRTSDGAFVVPQPPRKSVSNPTTSVKGYEALMKKLQDIFSHIREASIEEGNRSLSDEKISVGIQASLSDSSSQTNGNASPDEVGKCDKATPKSSLKKTRVRGRRHIAGKTKRAILPTQHEEAEYMHGMNSPEMVPSNGDTGKMSPVKSPKDEKPLSSLVATPKSVSKLKQKRRPTSPRPATPVEKAVVKQEYPGYPAETVVLAKWVDKRYYSGKVLEITEPNKYLIKFDDGHSKALLDDFIIFGDMKTLPLQGQSVYAMVDEEQNYEPGLVMGIEENDSGTVTYRCITDGDSQVMVTASELYLTEDQARTLKEATRPRSPGAPSTPRRRHNRELDLDNIIQGPRSARSRDKASNNSARKRVASPKSPKASTSGVKSAKSTPVSRKRLASESSELSESSNSAPPVRIEEVAGVEPEVQRTPRKIDGVKAGPLQLKGAAKQNIGKKNSKLTKFSNDEDTISLLGPIPGADSKLFAGLHFLLTCTETPRRNTRDKQEKNTKQSSSDLAAALHSQETRHYSSEEDGETTTSMAGTDTEDLEFCDRPFNKERLKEQLEAGGGVVYSSRYCEVFAEGLGRFTGGTVSIHVREGARPVFMRARPLAYALREPVERALAQLVRDGVLTPVDRSDWATPIVPVMKKDGSIRICADYKLTLNKVIEVDRYPLPRVEDLLARLHGGEMFSKIDLSQAYAQFELDESKKYTVINTHKGLYMFNRLVFGLSSSPGIFQKRLEQLFADLPYVGVFLDDIVITGKNTEQHVNNLHKVFERLKSSGLRVKRQKCAFFQESINYLGHVINKKGIETCPEKVQAIVNTPAPTTVTEIRSFLGMVMYYAKFIKNVSTILAPIYNLLRTGVKFVWSNECETAFNIIKERLSSSEVLVHYSAELPLILTTDASSVGVGAVISHATPDGERPVAYASRSLTAAERAYSQIDREALGIIYGIRKFHQYLYGRQFTLRTDHKPLTYVFGNKTGIPIMAASRLQRWAVLLSGYNYVIEYVSSHKNCADALSRLPQTGFTSDHVFKEATYLNFVEPFLPVTNQDVKNATSKDTVLSKVVLYVQSGWPLVCTQDEFKPYYNKRNEIYLDRGCLMWGYRIIIPLILRKTVLKQLHTGHLGIVKTKSIARSFVWWPGIDADVEAECQSCVTCAAEAQAPTRSPPSPWPYDSRPWSRIHLDFLGPLDGKMFLIIIDSSSKWLEIFEMPKTNATFVIKMLRATFARFGLPTEVVSDQGPPFTSVELHDFLTNNGIRQSFSPVRHPSSNGAAENAVKLCKRALKKAVRDSVDIDAALQTFLLAYRNSVHSSTGESPAMLLQRRVLRSRLDLLRGERAREDRMHEVQARQVEQAGGKPRSLQAGETVLARGFSGNDKWLNGTVVGCQGSRRYVIQCGNGQQIHRHIDQIRRKSRYSVAECPHPESEEVVAPPVETNKGDSESNLNGEDKGSTIDQCQDNFLEPGSSATCSDLDLNPKRISKPVLSHFDDVPKNKYSVCKLIAPRPCLTAKYIQCLAADIRAVSHAWVIFSCINDKRMEVESYALPSGWSILKQCFINWNPPSGKRNTTFFKDKTILLCGDQDTFVKFWERVCTLAGANTRVVNEEDLNTTGAIALVTEWDCPHEVQNKANQDMIPLVSTFWVIQCLIEAKILPANSHDRFSFMYAEPE